MILKEKETLHLLGKTVLPKSNFFQVKKHHWSESHWEVTFQQGHGAPRANHQARLTDGPSFYFFESSKNREKPVPAYSVRATQWSISDTTSLDSVYNWAASAIFINLLKTISSLINIKVSCALPTPTP